MKFSSLRVGGRYLCVTRLSNKYFMTVKEIDGKRGRVLATRSTLNGETLRTQWYTEGTVPNWRNTDEAINRQLADTDSTAGLLSHQGETSGSARLHLDD